MVLQPFPDGFGISFANLEFFCVCRAKHGGTSGDLDDEAPRGCSSFGETAEEQVDAGIGEPGRFVRLDLFAVGAGEEDVGEAAYARLRVVAADSDAGAEPIRNEDLAGVLADCELPDPHRNAAGFGRRGGK